MKRLAVAVLSIATAGILAGSCAGRVHVEPPTIDSYGMGTQIYAWYRYGIDSRGNIVREVYKTKLYKFCNWQRINPPLWDRDGRNLTVDVSLGVDVRKKVEQGFKVSIVDNNIDEKCLALYRNR